MTDEKISPIEIRMFRDEHAKLFNYDIKAICGDYKKKHNLYTEKLTTIRNKMLTKKSKDSITNGKKQVT